MEKNHSFEKKRFIFYSFLCLLSAFPSDLPAAPQGTESAILTAQVQEAGKIRIFEGKSGIIAVTAEISTGKSGLHFVSDLDPPRPDTGQVDLGSGIKALYRVSVSPCPWGLKFHCSMTPLKDARILSVRESVYFPLKTWVGSQYVFGKLRGILRGAKMGDDDGVIASGKSPLSIGSGLEGGLRVQVSSHRSFDLADVRPVSPGVAVLINYDDVPHQGWNWRSGDTKTVDFTLTFDRPVSLNTPQPPKDLDELQGKITEVVGPYIDYHWCPGMAIGVIYKGQSWVGGFGTTSFSGGKRPDGNTEFQIGSITKLFTKLLFSDMVLQGRMHLEDMAQDYLPNGVKMPSLGGKQITLLMLSNHTSQLPHDPDDIQWSGAKINPYQDYSLDRLYNYLNRHGLTTQPGSSFLYSNTGVALLGDLIAQKSGMSWADYLQKRVLDPIGLRDTGVVWTPGELLRAAQGYDWGMNPLKLWWRWDQTTFMPAISLHSTVNDLLKLARAAMVENGSPLANIAFNETAQKLDWGTQVTHEGRFDGFETFFLVDRAPKIALVILVNCEGNIPVEISGKIRGLLKGYWPSDSDLPVLAHLSSDQEKPYIGQYRPIKMPSSWSSDPPPEKDFKIVLREGRLVAVNTQCSCPDVPIDPLANGNFYMRNQHLELTFTKDKSGKVTGFVSEDYPDYVVKKIDTGHSK